MANESNPNDPSRANDPYRANDPSRSKPNDDSVGRETASMTICRQIPNSPRVKPALQKLHFFAFGIAVLLGAVFYGLNNSSMHQTGNSSMAQKTAPPTAQNTAPTSPPAAPPGVRNVIPPANTSQGVTTGAAPSQTTPPPASSGSTDGAPASK